MMPVLQNIWDKLSLYRNIAVALWHRKRFRQLLADPYASTLYFSLGMHWTNEPVAVAKFSETFRENYQRLLVQEGTEIAAAPSPRLEMRVRLADAMAEVARMLVLVMAPPPDEDRFGLRGQLGLSGELRERLLEILNANSKDFEEWLPVAAFRDREEAVAAINGRFLLSLARANVLCALREPLGDIDANREVADWYRAALLSTAAFWEHQFRLSLNMPATLPQEPEWGRHTDMKHKLYFDCVRDGSPFPDEAWVERCAAYLAVHAPGRS
jgi:hypothetical protein